MTGTRRLLPRALCAASAGLIAVLAVVTGTARAAEGPWSDTEHTQVRLISAADAVGEGGSVSLGLQFRMAPGWKIYWRTPGDAGFPPIVDWQESQNLADAVIAWPAPERFSVLGFETAGYKDQVVLPLTVTLREPGQPLSLRGEVNFLTCDEICIPYQVPLSLHLPAGAAKADGYAHLIDQFAARVPGDGRGHGLHFVGSEVAASGEATRLRIAVEADVAAAGPLRAPDIFIEGPPELVFGAPRVSLRAGGREALLDVPVDGIADLAQPLSEQALTVTVVDGDRSAEWRVSADTGITLGATDGAAAAAVESRLWLVLALALAGGLILNLMPCVLPVLSLKLLSVVSHGGGERRHVRSGFIASAAGIMTAFMVLAGGLVVLKASGAAIGWGIQFQQPWFLIAMSVVVTLFAANLWGFFEVALPGAVADAAGRSGPKHGLAGHFATGAFATLLATPCSAPFLGTAVGFALSRGAADIFLVFAFLGLGMALPYLAVAAVPGLATRLPRPGRWMIVLRRLLGFALAATAAWLVSVLVAQLGVLAAAVVALALAAMTVLLFVLSRRGGPGRFGAAGAMAFAFLALSVPAWIPAPDTRPAAAADAAWRPFDEAAISDHIAGGRVVLVDITADWCLTCKVNKAAVLDRGAVRERLQGTGVVAMQGDWTRPDAAIAGYLARFGRYGIPFNVVYGPRAPHGIALPEVLTADTVTEALDAAAPVPLTAAR